MLTTSILSKEPIRAITSPEVTIKICKISSNSMSIGSIWLLHTYTHNFSVSQNHIKKLQKSRRLMKPELQRQSHGLEKRMTTTLAPTTSSQ